MYCARHPTVETNLKCGKCDSPICPKCTVQTPVGARCPRCANLTKLPMFQVSLIDYLKASGIGLGLAIGLGIVWHIVGPFLLGFSYLAILPIGYAIGEIISLGVNRKRNKGLVIIAGVCIVVCFALGSWFYLHLYGIVALIIAVVIAANRLR